MLYHDGDQIVPIRTSTFADDRKHQVTLLVITDGNEKFHYLSVQSMSRLIMTGANISANITYVTIVYTHV